MAVITSCSRRPRSCFLLMLLALFPVHGGAGPALVRAAAPVAPVYVDLVDFPVPEANWDRFFDLERRLEDGFDRICGDTFCEGQFSNYRAMQFRCTVHLGHGTVQACRWVFAASTVQADPHTGALRIDARTWACSLPIAAGTSVDRFHTALQGRDALDAPLPGTLSSVYDALTECLH